MDGLSDVRFVFFKGDTIAQLDAYQVSGLPVTDDNGHLIGNFSITNLLSIWADNANESISLTVEAFLAKYSPGLKRYCLFKKNLNRIIFFF